MDKKEQTAEEEERIDNLRISIVERLRKKEFIARCNAVRMCHTCGEDWVDTAGPSNHHVIYSCQNKECSEHDITKEHIYPNG
jgi:hypothetical protein